MMEFYTVEELSKVLKINEETIRRMIRTKKIKSYIKLGRGYRIPKEEVKRLIENNNCETTISKKENDPIIMTNKQKLLEMIKNESNLEIAKFLTSCEKCKHSTYNEIFGSYVCGIPHEVGREHCVDGIIRWLMSEVE